MEDENREPQSGSTVEFDQELVTSSPLVDYYFEARFNTQGAVNVNRWLDSLSADGAEQLGRELVAVVGNQEAVDTLARKVSVLICDLVRQRPEDGVDWAITALRPLLGSLDEQTVRAILNFRTERWRGHDELLSVGSPQLIIALEHGEEGLTLAPQELRSRTLDYLRSYLLEGRHNGEGRVGFGFNQRVDRSMLVLSAAEILESFAGADDLDIYQELFAFAAGLQLPDDAIRLEELSAPHQHSTYTQVEEVRVAVPHVVPGVMTMELTDAQRLAIIARDSAETKDVDLEALARSITNEHLARVAWLKIASDKNNRQMVPQGIATPEVTQPSPTERAQSMTLHSQDSLRSALEALGYTQAEIQQEYDQQHPDMHFATRTSLDSLMQIAAQGRLKSSHETLITGGSTNKGYDVRGYDDFGRTYVSRRIEAEEKYGLRATGMFDDAHPLSGYLDNGTQKGDMGRMYGNVKIVLKPEVLDRTVFVLGDSANNAGSDQDPEFMGWEDAQLASMAQAKAIQEGKIAPGGGPVALRGWNYTEGICLGGITLNDIDYVEIVAVSIDHARRIRTESLPYLTSKGLEAKITLNGRVMKPVA